MSSAPTTTFERFATTTIIRVFNFIRTSSFLVERLFWLAVLVGFSTATIFSVQNTVTNFLSEPTASQVSLVLADSVGGITFPNGVICFEVRPDILLTLYEGKADQVVAQIEQSAKVEQALQQKFREIHTRENARIENLKTALNNMSSPTITAENGPLGSYHAIDNEGVAVPDENDVALIALSVVMFQRLSDLEVNVPVTYKSHPPGVIKVYDAYVKKGTNFSRLFHTIAEALCIVQQLRVVATETNLQSAQRRHTPIKTCGHAVTVTFLGLWYSNMEIICYRFQRELATLALKSSFDYITLSIHPRALYGMFKGNLDDGQILVDLSGTLDTAKQQAMQAKYNQQQTIEFALEIFNTMVNLRRRPCSTTGSAQARSDFYCRLWCHLEAVSWGCECFPLMANFYAAHLVELPNYFSSCAARLIEPRVPVSAKCRDALSTGYMLRNFSSGNCSQECVPDCETLVYSSITRSGDPSLSYLNGTTAVKLVSTKFFYQQIVEFVTMDGKAFVAALGGNLSLYLGASFLALIHIVVFFVRLPFEHGFQFGSATTPAAPLVLRSSYDPPGGVVAPSKEISAAL